MKINFRHILTLIAAYLLLLAWIGYSFGHGDTIELFPYAKWLNNNELYPKDFFIQNISASSINERIVLAYFFSWFGEGGMEVGSLLLHFLCCVFLLEGLFRIGKMFIRKEGLIWAAVMVAFIPFFGWNLGGNEMYIPLVSSSTVAKAMGIWAIYFFLKKENEDRYFWFVNVLLLISTFVQPLVGLQLFLIMTGARVVTLFFEKRFSISKFSPTLLYLLTAGIWIYFLQKDFAAEQIDNRLLFDFFEFRLPHHFIPSAYSKKSAILLLPLFAWSLFFYKKNNSRLFWFFVIALLGCLVYVIGVDFLESSTIVSAQWFKTTIWLKSFSFMAIVAFLERRFDFLSKKIINGLCIWGLRILGVLGVFIIINPISIFKNRTYDFFFLNKNSNSSEIEIAEIAKANTPEDALFIIPISNTHFKYYSERSTYIDYKAVIHRKQVIPIWYERAQEVYGVNLETRQSGEEISKVADDRFSNFSEKDLNVFSKKGIQYLLTFKEMNLPYEVIGENEKYRIFKIGN